MSPKEIKKAALPVFKAYGIKHAALFGSAATGSLRKNSDIDILIETKKKIGLFTFVAIKFDLERRLGRKVDIVEYKAIKPALREQILSQQIVLV